MESTTITASSQVLFLGELPFWHKISQSILDAPGASFLVRRSASLREALRLLEGGDWHALLVDFSHPAAQELLAAQKLRGSAASIPVVALLPIQDSNFRAAAEAAGAPVCLVLDEITPASLRDAILDASRTKHDPRPVPRANSNASHARENSNGGFHPSKMDALAHALNNLLCVIHANAEILSDELDPSHRAVRSVSQIKKATKSAVDLMRHLTTP